jgi:hypothetical protein
VRGIRVEITEIIKKAADNAHYDKFINSAHSPWFKSQGALDEIDGIIRHTVEEVFGKC